MKLKTPHVARSAVLFLAIVISSPSAFGGQSPARPPAPAENVEIEALHIRGPLWLLTGAGCNVIVSVGPDGVLVVDTGAERNADKLLGAIRKLQDQLAVSGVAPLGYAAETRSSLERERVTPAPPKPVRYVLNTTFDTDHVGGNLRIATSGVASTGGNIARDLGPNDEGAPIFAHENVLTRMNTPGGTQPEPPLNALPRFTYRTEYYKLQPFVNGEGVELIHRPAANTDADSMVWFRGSDVIAAGDLFSTMSYPIIDLGKGGSIQGEIDALNAILDLAFPEYIHQGGTLVIPGHGRISDHADVAYYRDMVTIIRDRVQDMMKKGLTLEQVKTGRPTEDYDTRYGSATGSWTTDKFIEAVYRSLGTKH